MRRSAMWQLNFANQLFIPGGSVLGASEICYDVNTELWEYKSDAENESDDDHYSCEEHDSNEETSDSDSDLDSYCAEDI